MTPPQTNAPRAVTVTRRGVERVESGHLWIYRSDVKSAAGLEGGEAVRVVDARGWFVGTAFYSSRSQIALRLLSREAHPVDELLAERLRLAVEARDRILPGAEAVRLVHGEGDHLPGLVADRYRHVLVVQTLTQAMERRKQDVVSKLLALTGATVAVERNDVPARRHEGLEPLRGVLVGEPPGTVEYREGEVLLTADPLEGQKTGAFLDQRENHLRAGELARGRALDCFSFEGGFALQLARRATSVTAVDSSERAVEAVRSNAARNGLGNVEAKAANVFDFLRAQSDAGERYDTVVLDPPAFTKSRDSVEAALRGYKEVNLRALTLLRPGGVLVTASCSYHVDEESFSGMLLSAARDAGRSLQVLERRGASPDHPELLGVPETRYLKCFFARVL